jgi:hypothetical protein
MRSRLRASLPQVRQRTSAQTDSVYPPPPPTPNPHCPSPRESIVICGDDTDDMRATALQACDDEHATTLQACEKVVRFSRFISMG